MNWVDLIIVIGFLWAAADGWRRGVWAMGLDILSLLVSATLAYLFFEPVGHFLQGYLPISNGMAPLISFLVAFWLIDLVLRFALGFIYHEAMTHWLPKDLKVMEPVRIAGIIFALGKQFVLYLVLVNLILFLPVVPELREGIEQSRLSPYFVSKNPTLERVFSKIIEPAVHEAQRFITTEVTDKSVAINSPVTRLEVDNVAEQEMLRLVNEERAKRGLRILKWNEKLAEVGRAHSKDMWERHFFSHVNPDGKTPFDRLNDAGVKYLAAGENLALAPTTDIAHRGLMESPGHRENILSPDYGQIGIGVIRNGLYGAMYTQMFMN